MEIIYIPIFLAIYIPFFLIGCKHTKSFYQEGKYLTATLIFVFTILIFGAPIFMVVVLGWQQLLAFTILALIVLAIYLLRSK